jgi:hypothetical protein
MKTFVRIALISLAALVAGNTAAFAQARGDKKARPSPNASISQTIGTTVVSVTYGRPGLKGRPFESLVPENKVWRTGANESTAITFSGDVLVGDASISAGTYSIYSIPKGGKFTIIINSKLSWGTQYDKSQDVARVTVPLQDGPSYEWFTIDFDTLSNSGAHMNLRWANNWAAVPIKVK